MHRSATSCPSTSPLHTTPSPNGNGKMDMNLVGIHREAFGFSSNADGTFDLPASGKAAFTLDTDSLPIAINVTKVLSPVR